MDQYWQIILNHFNVLWADSYVVDQPIYEALENSVKFFLACDWVELITSNREARARAEGIRTILMVTGYNTDIKHNGVVFHIQTEPRKDGGIETTVYMRGAVIHSVKTSQRDFVLSAEYSDDKFKQLLEHQHRLVIGRIRAGEIQPPAAAPAKT